MLIILVEGKTYLQAIANEAQLMGDQKVNQQKTKKCKEVMGWHTGKQDLKDGTTFLPLHSVLKTLFFYEYSSILDHNSTSFYCTPLIQVQPYF